MATPVNPHGNMERNPTTKTRRRNPAGAEGAALLIRPKLKNLNFFRKKCPFQCPIFLVYTDRQKMMFFHWFLNVFWGRRHIFWEHFSARNRYHPSKMLIFHWFLGVSVAYRIHARSRRAPQGRIQGSFLPPEEPSSETLLGKNDHRKIFVALW